MRVLRELAGDRKRPPDNLIGPLSERLQTKVPDEIRQDSDLRARMRCVVQPVDHLEPLGAMGCQIHETFAPSHLEHLGDGSDAEPLVPSADLVAALDQHNSETEVVRL
jgi:hypothetical protein